MQVRFSTCIGMDVLEDSTGTVFGHVSGILIHPDTGKVEGFFLRVSNGLGETGTFVTAIDVLSLGTCVSVCSSDVLCDPDDVVRLRPLFADDRTIIGQTMRTESGKVLGRCADVQFETRSMHLQWLFPKKWWRWGAPVSIKDVLEVRSAAIILKDPAPIETVEASEGVELPSSESPQGFPEIPEPGMTRQSAFVLHQG